MDDQDEAMKYAIALLEQGASFDRDQLSEVSVLEAPGESNKVVDVLNWVLDLDGYEDKARQEWFESDDAQKELCYYDLCRVAHFRYGLTYLSTGLDCMVEEGFEGVDYTGLPTFSLVVSPDFKTKKVVVTAAKYCNKVFNIESYEINFNQDCKDYLSRLEGYNGKIIPSNILGVAKFKFQEFVGDVLERKPDSWKGNIVDKVFVKPWVIKIADKDITLVDNAELDEQKVVININFEPKDDNSVAKKLSEASYDGTNLIFPDEGGREITDENIAKLLLGEVSGYKISLFDANNILIE